MAVSNLNEALPSLLRLIGTLLSCIVLTIVSWSIKASTALGFILVGAIESMTGAKPKKAMAFHHQRHETKNLLYLGQYNTNSIIDERLTLFNSLSQVLRVHLSLCSIINNILNVQITKTTT